MSPSRYVLACLLLLTTKPILSDDNNTPATDTVTDIHKALAEGMLEPTVLPTAAESKVKEIEVLLTPWWNMTFSEGETVSVDCGFYTGGKPEEYTMEWLSSDQQTIVASDRHELQTNAASGDTKNSVYSVVTLTIQNLTQEDGGKLTCRVTRKSDNVVFSDSLHVDVLSSDEWCGFEGGADLCGWTSDGAHAWQRRESAEEEHEGDPMYDHTYGPSKHIGHFMDVSADADWSAVESSLVSPIYTEAQPRCLHFYYAISGSDADALVVNLIPDIDNDDQIQTLTTITEAHGCSWRHYNVSIPSQESPYKVEFVAQLCSEKCEDAHIALDDIHVTQGLCQQHDHEDTHSVGLKTRLTGGNSTHGRLEVLHDGQYGTVCSKGFTITEAQVACVSMGLSAKGASLMPPDTNTLPSAPDNQVIWLSQLACPETADNLAACLTPVSRWGIAENCSHVDDVVISCGEATTTNQDKLNPSDDNKVSTFTSLPSAPNTTTVAIATGTTQLPSSTSTTITPTPTQPTEEPTQSSTLTSTKLPTTTPKKTTPTSTTVKTTTPMRVTTPTTPANKSKTTKAPEKVHSSTETQPSTTQFRTTVATKSSRHAKEHEGGSLGRGLVAGIVIIILLALAVFVFIVYKGRKRRLRKSKYTNFGSSNYSTEHLPTNEFHLESPLTMSSMGYTVLA